MKYLGTVRNEDGRFQMPDSFGNDQRASTYEAIDIGGDILLVAGPLERMRLERIESLRASITDHRSSLEGLAK